MRQPDRCTSEQDDSSYYETSLAELTAVNRLARCLESEELCLHYQPKVELASGRIVGAEALVRWQDPERGLLLPERFIRTAERSGQIVELGRWVLEKACVQTRRWQLQGLPLYGISVNTSPLELEEKGYVDHVRQSLKRAGMSPDMLTLEITESMALQGARQIAHLFDLAELGVSISLDDFGTGHASLQHLRQLPIHELKIDRSFISGLMCSSQDLAIVSALISLARSSNIISVAEGVETLEQQAKLAELGCEQVQGNVISPALAPPQFDRYVWESFDRATLLDAVLSD